MESPTKVTRGYILTENGFKNAILRNDVPFLGHGYWRPHLGVKFPQNR